MKIKLTELDYIDGKKRLEISARIRVPDLIVQSKRNLRQLNVNKLVFDE